MPIKERKREGQEFLLSKLREEPERFITASSYLKDEADRSRTSVPKLLDKLAKNLSEGKPVSGTVARADPAQFLARIHAVHDDVSAPSQLDDSEYSRQTDFIMELKNAASRHSLQPETLLNKIEKELYANALHIDLEDIERKDRALGFGSQSTFETIAAGLRDAYKRLLKSAIVSLDTLVGNPLALLAREERDSSLSKEITSAQIHLGKKMAEAGDLGLSFSLDVDWSTLIKDDDVVNPQNKSIDGRFIKLLPEDAVMFFGSGDGGDKLVVRFSDIKSVSLVDEKQKLKSIVYNDQTFMLIMKEMLSTNGFNPFMMAHMLYEMKDSIVNKGVRPLVNTGRM